MSASSLSGFLLVHCIQGKAKEAQFFIALICKGNMIGCYQIVYILPVTP
jgi:hypothetical protein